MLVTMPIPNNWPEQTVAIVDEDIPANIANVTYRNLESGVRQIVASIPQVRAREDIKIAVTFEVRTSQINPAPDVSLFKRPKTSHKAGRTYLGVSAQINYRNNKLKKEVKSIVKDKTEVWDQIETIYDWVRDNIEDTSTEAKDALSTFRDRKGCSEDKVGLFVAMCRAHKIPARMVWVQGAQYAEFMLIDDNSDPHWFPCDVGGIREFGSVSEPRIILQKGDSIRVPEKESRQKLVAEFATCKGKSKPSVRFHREILSEE
jgi:transglutaminase-like putative cysteine protease